MNDRITLGAAVLTAALIVGALYSRWWVSPLPESGPYSDGDITVVTPIAELMSVGEWEPVYGIALELARGERA